MSVSNIQNIFIYSIVHKEHLVFYRNKSFTLHILYLRYRVGGGDHAWNIKFCHFTTGAARGSRKRKEKYNSKIKMENTDTTPPIKREMELLSPNGIHIDTTPPIKREMELQSTNGILIHRHKSSYKKRN